jgi:hypothetical protein
MSRMCGPLALPSSPTMYAYRSFASGQTPEVLLLHAECMARVFPPMLRNLSSVNITSCFARLLCPCPSVVFFLYASLIPWVAFAFRSRDLAASLPAARGPAVEIAMGSAANAITRAAATQTDSGAAEAEGDDPLLVDDQLNHLHEACSM